MYGFQSHAARRLAQMPTPEPHAFADGGAVPFGSRGVSGLRDLIPKMQAMGYQQVATAPAPAEQSGTARLRSMIPQMEAMGYKQQPQYLARGGVVRGPGTGTSDSIDTEAEPGTFIMPADSTETIGPDALEKLGTVPVKLSNGEFEFPPEQVMALGMAVLKLLKDTTHEPVHGEDGGQADEEVGEGAAHENAEAAAGGVEDDAGEEGQGFQPGARERMAQMPMAFADGGPVQNDIARVGNSYSGGNVGGDVSINGQAGAGTVSTSSWTSPVAAIAPTPAPAAAPAASAMSATTPAPAPAPAPAAPMGWAERNAQRNNQVTASSIMDSPERRMAQSALAPPPAPAPTPAAAMAPQATWFPSAAQRLGTLSQAGQPAAWYQPRRYADGGVVQDDLAKRLEQIPVGEPVGWTGGGRSAASAPLAAAAVPAAAPAEAPAPAPAPSGALSRAASLATPAPAPEPATQALSTLATQGFTPSGQSTGAADGLARRGAADAMALMPNAPPPVQAPVIRNSTNDWAARKQLENLATSASSITNDRRWGGEGAKSQDRLALQQAQATDAALQMAAPRLAESAMREQGDTQRAGLSLSAAAANSAADRMGAMDRTLITERGNNTRAGITALAATEAARIKALQDGKAPAGYRYTAGGNMEAIPGGPADLRQNKEGVQQGKDTQDIFSILNEARPLLGSATNSYAGVGLDKLGQTFGFATDGAKATAQLRALEGALVSKMPKMSGPQSDKDVLLYKQMAGQIGDPTIPVEQRRAAMSTIENLNVKYLPAVQDATGYQAVPSGSYYKTPAGEVRRKP